MPFNCCIIRYEIPAFSCSLSMCNSWLDMSNYHSINSLKYPQFILIFSCKLRARRYLGVETCPSIQPAPYVMALQVVSSSRQLTDYTIIFPVSICPWLMALSKRCRVSLSDLSGMLKENRLSFPVAPSSGEIPDHPVGYLASLQ